MEPDSVWHSEVSTQLTQLSVALILLQAFDSRDQACQVVAHLVDLAFVGFSSFLFSFHSVPLNRQSMLHHPLIHQSTASSGIDLSKSGVQVSQCSPSLSVLSSQIVKLSL